MQCFVYASLKKQETYLWVVRRDDFGALPEPLLLLLGELQFVLEVQLDPQRKLPLEDTRQVLADLDAQGWHLQAPASETLACGNPLEYRRAPHDERSRGWPAE